MTGRDRIEQAFTPEGTPAFGAVICYEGIFVRDHWDEVTDQPWWVMQSPDLDAQVAHYADRIERLGQDWFRLPRGMSRLARERIAVEEREDGVYHVDRETGRCERLARPEVSGWRADQQCQSIAPEDMPLTRNAVAERLAADTMFPHDRALPEGADELPRRILDGPGCDLFPIAAVGSPLWSNYSLWGFQGLMNLIVEDPDLVQYACGLRLERVRQSLAVMAEIGVRGVWIEECLTDMISPEAFRRLNVPYVRAVVEAVREAGMLSVYYYCGNPNDRWDLLLDCGADALSLEESKKGFDIDIERVVDVVQGRCAVLGNLDAIELLRRGSPETLRAEIERQIAAGRRNASRFVMSIGSPVTPETPLSRVRLYTDMVHELGRP